MQETDQEPEITGRKHVVMQLLLALSSQQTSTNLDSITQVDLDGTETNLPILCVKIQRRVSYIKPVQTQCGHSCLFL